MSAQPASIDLNVADHPTGNPFDHTDPRNDAPVPEATDPTSTQTPDPAPAAPTADQAVAAPAKALEAMTLGEVRAEALRRGFSTVTKGTKAQMIAAMRRQEADDDEPTDEPTTSSLAAACAAGTVKVFKLRSSGTTRRIPWLTGTAREHAEFFRMLTETGASVREIAEETGVSRATVRRTLWALDLVEAIEAGHLDDLYEDGETELVLGGFGDEDGGDDQ